MNVVAVRAYESYNGGLRPAGELWAENLGPELSRAMTIPKKTRGTAPGDLAALGEEIADVRVLVHTNPSLVSGIPKKVPEIMEMPINGGSMSDRLSYAQSLLGQQIPVSSVFELGDLVDTSAITKGQEKARQDGQAPPCGQPGSLESIPYKLARSPARSDGLPAEDRI